MITKQTNNQTIKQTKNQNKKQGRGISPENKRFYKNLGRIFAIFFCGFFLLHVILPDGDMSASEKRMLNRFPSISKGSVFSGSFGEDFEEYASDQMPFRDAFVSLKTFADSVTGKKESQGVYRGKGGFLIEKMNEPDPAVLETTTEAIRKLTGMYPSSYSFVLVPNAVSIYKEKLPAFAPTASQEAYSAALGEKLAPAGVQFLDLTEALMAAKETVDPLYYRTDHHWTTQAAYACRPAIDGTLGNPTEGNWSPLLVSDSFIGSLASKSGFSSRKTDSIYVYVPETPVNYLISGSSREGKQASLYSEEGLKSNDPYTVFLGGNDGYLHIETDQAGKGSLLVFKDSYFNCYLPFLLHEYETIDVIDPRYFCDDLQSLLLQNQYRNVLFFYDVNTFSEDTSLSLVLGELAEKEESTVLPEGVSDTAGTVPEQGELVTGEVEQ